MPSRARTPVALGAAAALLVIAGCGSPHEDHFAILGEEPTEPVPEYVYSDGILEPESARFLAEDDGIEYYVGQLHATPGDVCLVSVNTADPETRSSIPCGAAHGIIRTTSDDDVEAALVPDTVDDAELERLTEDGWTEASPNLWLR